MVRNHRSVCGSVGHESTGKHIGDNVIVDVVADVRLSRDRTDMLAFDP